VARVTVEDCLEKVPNRFALVILAAERARMLSRRARPLIECENKAAVTSLREIAADKVRFTEDIKQKVEIYLEEMRQRGNKRTILPAPKAAAAAAAESPSE
jgi:DNA-directed RNA polymerase subunit omega